MSVAEVTDKSVIVVTLVQLLPPSSERSTVYDPSDESSVFVHDIFTSSLAESYDVDRELGAGSTVTEAASFDMLLSVTIYVSLISVNRLTTLRHRFLLTLCPNLTSTVELMPLTSYVLFV